MLVVITIAGPFLAWIASAYLNSGDDYDAPEPTSRQLAWTPFDPAVAERPTH